MGLASALSTALTGLTAAETTIDVAGNNLANSNTVGFKASEANFANQFLQTQSLGSAPTTTSGGSNPRQTGLGTMVADITPDFTQGTIEISSNSTDMAIQGDGFFIVQGDNTAEAYTRNGIFKMNAASELTTITGNRLLGYGVNSQFDIQTTALEPITIPLGSLTVANATTEALFNGTLAAQGEVSTAAKILESAVLGDNIYTHPELDATFKTEVTTAPNVSAVTRDPVVDGAGTLPASMYYYKLVFSDGPPSGVDNPDEIPVEGVPAAGVAISSAVGPGGTNAVRFTGLTALVEGNYQNINFYRSTTLDGTYTYAGTTAATNDTFVDTGTTGTADTINETVLTGAYKYYVAFGNASGVISRPSELVELTSSVSDGRVHLSNLPSAGLNPNEWNKWIIYRNAPDTEAGPNRYFELKQISFPTAPSTINDFSDNIPDSVIYTSEDVHTAEIDLDGPKIRTDTLLSNVRMREGTDYKQVFSDTGTLTFTGAKGGRDTATRTFTLAPTSTVGQFCTFLEQTLGIQEATATNQIHSSEDLVNSGAPIPPGYQVLTNGRIRLTGNNGVDNAIDIKTLTGTLASLPFTTYQNANGVSTAVNFNTYDSLGISCNVELTMVLEDRISGTATVYRWYADSRDNQPSTVGNNSIAVGTGLISFDGKGAYIPGSDATIDIDRSQYPSVSPLQIDLDFSTIAALGTDNAVKMYQQDGFAPGVLSSFIVGEDGMITGVFSNSATRTLGQIRLARFGNPAGLQQLGQNLFAAGVNSGMPMEGNPGEQGIGSIVAGAVELSNADVGSNLIDLILASTMYRSNTRTITTVQQMLDELLQLRR
jgi:flagellar hook protein FlgE